MRNKGQKDEYVLKRERTPEFFEAAKALNDFVVKLDLDVEQNNELVHLMCDQVLAAEKGALAQGFKMGATFKDLEWKEATPVSGGVLS